MLQRGGVEDDVRTPYRREDGVVIADIADPEFEDVAEVLVDDLVGRAPGTRRLEPHFVLLCLVAGEDGHLLRLPELMRKNPSHEGLSQRTCAPRDEHTLSF